MQSKALADCRPVAGLQAEAARTRGRASGWYLAGVLTCSIVILLPDLIPAVVGRPEHTWSPLRSMNYHVGDLYYYAAYVREALDQGWPVHSPSAQELRGTPLIETWRFAGIFLAALPGLFLSDIRFVIIAGYALSVTLYFSAGFAIARTLGVGPVAAAVAGFAVTFWTDRVWTAIPTHPDRITDTVAWLGTAWTILKAAPAATLTVPDIDYYGNAFRYVNMSLSGPILLMYFALVVFAYVKESRVALLALAGAAPLMAFSYPSHTLIAYALLVIFAGISLLQRNMQGFVGFSAVGAATLIFLEAIGYRSLLSNVFQNSELWLNIFQRERFEIVVQDANEFFGVLLNKYSLSAMFLLWLLRKNKGAFWVAFAVSVIGVGLSLVHLFATPQLWARFLGRGIDPIWFLMLVVAIAVSLARLGQVGEASSVWKRLPPASRYVRPFAQAALVGVVVAIPAICFARVGIDRLHDGGKFLPNAVYESYRWMGKNVPSQGIVAAADWEDITLLPVYTTVDLVVGHSVIDGRSPTDELRRYVDLWKFLGRSKDELIALLDTAPKVTSNLGLYGASRPFLGGRDFEASQLMLGVIYWPYVNLVDGVTVVDPKTGNITPQFRNVVDAMFARANPAEFLDHYKVDYVLMPADEARSLAANERLSVVFSNSARVVLAVERR